MINHRGPEFAALLRRVTERLQYFFQTAHPILGFPAAGTGAMEASIVNLFSPGDAVVALTVGVFGDRLAEIASAFGLAVTRVAFPWGQAADPDVVVAQLATVPQARGILLTHNETSTGVTNDLKALATAIRSHRPDLLIVVDAVSSLSCVEVCMDEWDLDVVFTASQKGWMVPPGLALIGVGPRAWSAVETASLPRAYWDFRAARRSLEKGQTPYTPPVNIYQGLDVALEMLLAEGRSAVFARHQALGALVRGRAHDLRLELFADPAHASNTVTAIRVPQGLDAATLVRALRDQESVVVAGGQGRLEGHILRVGHMGYAHVPEVASAMDALGRQLAALSHPAKE